MYDPVPNREAQNEENEASPIIRRVGSADSVQSASSRGSSIGASNTRNVRINVIQDGVSQRLSRTQVGPDGSTRGNYALVVLQTAMQLPPALAALVMVPITAKTESCNQPLAFWAFCYALTLLAALAVSWTIYFEPTEEVSEMSRQRRMAESLRKPLENFALGWLIMGQVWLQGASDCSDSAPALLTLCFWLVIIGYCYFLLPCIIIVLMLPFLCFCLPCVIRLLSRFIEQNEAGLNKGATQDAIDSLPLKKYHQGLIQDEADPQCVICLSSYEPDQDVRFLPCDARHHFHASCVDGWLKVNASCPICRGRIDGSEAEGDNESSTVDLEAGSINASDFDEADDEARRPLASSSRSLSRT
ncbi:E3 ubiquitin-protein ligase RNF13 [Hondaea fermentalgiana]|uniref:E3 ubiquitin-protein ligase RNF13 n=1 Tax=Hondaea fermentalgiana TaxID=2315210 RepID=A0A2R5G0M4_9STRA|nr:E3 ubiquitin-protein ligase RNF13 [Hondaea fermentalgiana]|eukprot:GBG24550.1 E3 ubiquitin-protein ligase RNF13 [Hondaea fermentalgiana]